MTIEDEITKNYLAKLPNEDDPLPKGWEIRFGYRGRWMKYDSVEHCEKKNPSFLDSELKTKWEQVKSSIINGDELWIHWNNNIGTSVCLVRDEKIIERMLVGHI